MGINPAIESDSVMGAASSAKAPSIVGMISNNESTNALLNKISGNATAIKGKELFMTREAAIDKTSAPMPSPYCICFKVIENIRAYPFLINL
jgi:hypothetical protein